MPAPALWAPWRIEYIESIKPPGCFLCLGAAQAPSVETLVLGRGSRTVVLLNRYPYASGHILIAPRAHLGDLAQLPDEVVVESARMVKLAVGVLGQAMSPHGFNVGINLGEAAGAGVPDHLHWHIVPRWTADTNFMPMLADTRVVPEHLEATWRRLHGAFAEGAARAELSWEAEDR